MCKLFIIFLFFLFSPVLSDLGEWMENKDEETLDSYTNKKPFVRFCESFTPCGWRIYPQLNYPSYRLINNFCSCTASTSCTIYQKRLDAGFTEYRCQPIKPEA